MKSLVQLHKGERGYIVDMRDARLCELLFELGCFPGDLVEIQENDLLKNSIRFKVKNRVFHLHRPAAETIITHIVSFEFHPN